MGLGIDIVNFGSTEKMKLDWEGPVVPSPMIKLFFKELFFHCVTHLASPRFTPDIDTTPGDNITPDDNISPNNDITTDIDTTPHMNDIPPDIEITPVDACGHHH